MGKNCVGNNTQVRICETQTCPGEELKNAIIIFYIFKVITPIIKIQ